MNATVKGRPEGIPQTHRIIVQAIDPRDLESKLDLGVRSLIERAHEFGDRGVLVTRLSPEDYIIELHPGVPFGTTHECCRWGQRGT